MPFFPHKKNQFPSISAPINVRVASRSQGGQQSQSPTKSQSQSPSKSPQQTQQSQPLSPWSAHTPASGKWPSPFPRRSPAISTTATAAGELFLFGGMTPDRIYNDQYVISTRDFSTTLWQTSGDVPNPRYGHSAVLTSTNLFIWGGKASFKDQIADDQNQTFDNSLYLLNLVSREWTRIVVNGPGPCGRYYHTMTLVGSKLFVFGGRTTKRRLNDIWALDLNCLESNPFWESYDPAPGNEKPLPTGCHVSVTTDDRIFIFGGSNGKRFLNDTWSFNVSTRKWTELQCTGSIPFPRAYHAAVLVDGVMYVFGGRTVDETRLGDLTAFNLSTQRWITFQDIAPSPSGRFGHAMACDGTRVLVFGGKLSRDAHADETKLIHVLDIKQLVYPEPDLDAVNEKTVRKSSPSPPTRDQPHQPSSSLSDTQAAHGASPFQKATPEELDHPTSGEITRERNPSLNGLPSRPTGASGKPRHVPAEDDDGEDSTEHHATKLVAPDLPSGKEIARLENGRLIELERQLSETLVAKTERDQRIAQLIDELALKSALLEQAEANAAEEKKHARLEPPELQAKLDESLLSRDHPPDKERAGRELRELQAKLDESLLSRDHALEQAKSALQKASCAAEAHEQSKRELIEMRAELEASKSELAAFRLRLADTENGGSKSKAEPDTYRNQTETGLVNTDVDQVVHRLMERMQTMEAEIATLRWNEKSFEMMECRNEG